MSVIVHSELTGVTTFGLPSGQFVDIKPGNNPLTDEQYDAIKDNPIFKARKKIDKFKLVAEGKSMPVLRGDGQAKDLSKMKAEEAITYVSGVVDEDQLRRYLDDTRTTVVRAVQSQMEKLKEIESASENED